MKINKANVFQRFMRRCTSVLLGIEYTETTIREHAQSLRGDVLMDVLDSALLEAKVQMEAIKAVEKHYKIATHTVLNEEKLVDALVDRINRKQLK